MRLPHSYRRLQVPTAVRGVAAVAGLLLLAFAPATFAPAAAADVFTHGAEARPFGTRTQAPEPGQVLAVVSRDNGDATTGVWFRTVVAGPAEWHRVARFGLPVVGMASRGDDLAVLLELPPREDGRPRTQLRFVFARPGGPDAPVETPAPPPPPGTRVVDVAGGWPGRNGHDPLFALLAGDEGPAVARLGRGEWTLLPPLPEVLATADLRLGSAGRSPFVAALLDGRVLVAVLRDEAWDVAETPAPAEATRLVPVSGAEGLPLLLAVTPAGDFLLPSVGGAVAVPYEGENLPDFSPGDARAAAAASGAVRVVRLAGGTPVEVVFDGSTLDVARTATPLRPGDPPTPGRPLTIVLYVLLGLAVLMVLRQGPYLGTPEQVKHVTSRLAPLGLRLLAGGVDALPLIVVAGLLPLATERLSETAVYVVAGAGVGVYLVHLIVAEALTGRSLGKVMFGLLVVKTDGSPAGPFAAVGRNILRPLDWAALGIPLVLVLLTPMRQRLGDIAAGTTVVLSHPPAADPADTPENAPDGP